MLSRNCCWKLIVIRFCLKEFKHSIERKWLEILQHEHMCPGPSETPTTTFGRSTSCEVPGMALLTAGSYRSAAIYSRVQKTAACSSTATGLEPWDSWLREEPTRLPNTVLQEWKTELKSSGFPGCELQRKDTTAARFAFPQFITVILHSLLESPCYSRFHLFPLVVTISKNRWATQQLWSWLLTARLAWESSSDAEVGLLGLLGSPARARKYCTLKNLSWEERWAQTSDLTWKGDPKLLSFLCVWQGLCRFRKSSPRKPAWQSLSKWQTLHNTVALKPLEVRKMSWQELRHVAIRNPPVFLL